MIERRAALRGWLVEGWGGVIRSAKVVSASIIIKRWCRRFIGCMIGQHGTTPQPPPPEPPETWFPEVCLPKVMVPEVVAPKESGFLSPGAAGSMS